MNKKDAAEFFSSFLEKIENPYLIAFVLVFCWAIYCGPAYIKAIGDYVRQGRLNRIEVRLRQARLEAQLTNAIEKRQKRATGGKKL